MNFRRNILRACFPNHDIDALILASVGINPVAKDGSTSPANIISREAFFVEYNGRIGEQIIAELAVLLRENYSDVEYSEKGDASVYVDWPHPLPKPTKDYVSDRLLAKGYPAVAYEVHTTEWAGEPDTHRERIRLYLTADHVPIGLPADIYAPDPLPKP